MLRLLALFLFWTHTPCPLTPVKSLNWDLLFCLQYRHIMYWTLRYHLHYPFKAVSCHFNQSRLPSNNSGDWEFVKVTQRPHFPHSATKELSGIGWMKSCGGRQQPQGSLKGGMLRAQAVVVGHWGQVRGNGWLRKSQQALVSKRSQVQNAVQTQLMKHPRSLLLLLY